MEGLEGRTCRSWRGHRLSVAGDLRTSLRRSVQAGNDDLDGPAEEIGVIRSRSVRAKRAVGSSLNIDFLIHSSHSNYRGKVGTESDLVAPKTNAAFPPCAP